jgi:hypothetical protein
MGRRAREISRETFTPERHLEALLAHYEKLCREAAA